MAHETLPLVIGIGDPGWGDDGAGVLAARRLRETLADSAEVFEAAAASPATVIEQWEGRDCVIVIDAFSAGVPAGSVVRINATGGVLPAALSHASAHGVGLPEVLAFGATMQRLPQRLILYALGGLRFEAGESLTPAAAKAVAEAVARIEAELLASARPVRDRR